MTIAWYGHLRFTKLSYLKTAPLWIVILASWGIALFEYIFQVPANRLGDMERGGPFNLFELKTIQEGVSLTVFVIISVFVFKTEKFQWNHIVGFMLIIGAAFFIFKKW